MTPGKINVPDTSHSERRAQDADHSFGCEDPSDSMVQAVLKKDPFSGHLFAFRGRKADTMKILFWDGNGLCLFTKRLQQGRFIWPSLCEPGGTITLTPAQLAMLIEGIDWRTPERTWKPSLAG